MDGTGGGRASWRSGEERGCCFEEPLVGRAALRQASTSGALAHPHCRKIVTSSWREPRAHEAGALIPYLKYSDYFGLGWAAGGSLQHRATSTRHTRWEFTLSEMSRIANCQPASLAHARNIPALAVVHSLFHVGSTPPEGMHLSHPRSQWSYTRWERSILEGKW